MRHLILKSRITLLTLLALAICMACSKKEDSDPTGGDLVGTWEFTAFTYDGYFELFDDDDFVPIIGTVKDLDNVRITFNSNGTITGNGGTFTIVFASKADETEKLEFSGGFEDSGTYQRSGDILTVGAFFGEFTDKLHIAELTATTLRLTAVFQIEGTDSMSNVDFRFTRRN